MKTHYNPEMTDLRKSKKMDQFLEASGITIEILKAENISEVIAMAQKNQHRSGFKQMSDDVFAANNNVFNRILEESEYSCLIALDLKTKKIVGFVVFAGNDKSSAIIELGVDEQASYNPARKEGPKNVGSALLLAACNELFLKSANDIDVMGSTSNATNFYKRFGFIRDPQGDSTELVLKNENYKELENKVLSRCNLPENIGFFSNTPSKPTSSGSTNSPKIGGHS